MLFGKGRHQGVRFAVGGPLLPVLPVLALGQGTQVRNKGRSVTGIVADAAGSRVKLFAAFPDRRLDVAFGAVVLKDCLAILCGDAEVCRSFLGRPWLSTGASSSSNDHAGLEHDSALVSDECGIFGDRAGFAAQIHDDRDAAFLTRLDAPRALGQFGHRATARGEGSLDLNLLAGSVNKMELVAHVHFPW